MRRVEILTFVLVCVIVMLAVPVQGKEMLNFTVEPDSFSIGAFFNGGLVTVRGKAPSDSEILVRLIGERSDLHLKKKGKVMGFLWMNLGTVVFRDVPSVLLIYAPEQLGDYLMPSNKEDVPVAKLGLHHLSEVVKVEPETEDRQFLVRELIRLKRRDGLYAEHIGKVSYGESQEGRRSFEAAVEIPSKFAPGDYTLEVYAVRNGYIVSSKMHSLHVDLVGLPAMISSLAFEHGALYGVLATVIAILAGLLIGMIFGTGKGAH